MILTIERADVKFRADRAKAYALNFELHSQNQTGSLAQL